MGSALSGHGSAGLLLGEHAVGEVDPGLGVARAQAPAGLEGGQAVQRRPGDFRTGADRTCTAVPASYDA
jgi:hypothetical protein